MCHVLKYSLLALLLLVVACKESPTGTPNGNSLVGNWSLTQKTGGIGGSTTYPGSDIYILHITNENGFVESRNDTITFSDRFITYIDTTYESQVIDFVNSRRSSMVVSKVSSDSLSLWDGFIDGYFSFYTRVR